MISPASRRDLWVYSPGVQAHFAEGQLNFILISQVEFWVARDLLSTR